MSITISGDVPLEDVLAEIRRVYGVDFQVVDASASQEPDTGGTPSDDGRGRPLEGGRYKQDRT